MTQPPQATSEQSAGVVRLRLTVPAQLDLRRVPVAFGEPNADWLGQRVCEEGAEPRRFACDLELSVGPGQQLTFAKSAIVSFGTPEPIAGGWLVPIEWRSATLTALFPVFVGRLRLRADLIELEGLYAPPGGAIGLLLDRALLHFAARATGRWFVQKAIAALGGTSVGVAGRSRIT
jgi:hypothetical protein